MRRTIQIQKLHKPSHIYDCECGLSAPKKQAKENEQMFLRILFYCFHSLNKQTAMYTMIDSSERRTILIVVRFQRFLCSYIHSFIPSYECIRLFCLNLVRLAEFVVECNSLLGKMIDSVQALHETKWWTPKHVLLNNIVIEPESEFPSHIKKTNFFDEIPFGLLLWLFLLFFFLDIFSSFSYCIFYYYWY